MPKAPSSAIGIDIGRFSHKAVAMQRKGANRYVLTSYATLQHNAPAKDEAALAEQIKALLAELKSSAKGYGAAISSGEAIVRIIEQPSTPTNILRDAVRLNGMALLNQEAREYVIDCDRLSKSEPTAGGMQKYLVGALPRDQVATFNNAFESCRTYLDVIQLAPVGALNAFEFAHKKAFEERAFLLVDIGHVSSTVTVGAKGELLLVRTIEYGGRDLIEALTALADGNRQAALAQFAAGDETMMDVARYSLTALTREVSSSIGFFEARREENIEEIHVAGGAAGSQAILQIMAEDLHMPCKAWNPLERCEIALPEAQKAGLVGDMVNLHVACGVAAEILNAK